ncbi:unnamed protein product [Pleuronectes platessa]|uniref:Uncharacterized protein n=1 Tax=Pleuronectes platessa TaxID=8262 RepID=A0A9N7UQS2_PLEPL|nr:unnamed protein product [Pleuronectes platessa]
MGAARRSSARSRQRRNRLLGARQSVLVPDEVEFWRMRRMAHLWGYLGALCGLHLSPARSSPTCVPKSRSGWKLVIITQQLATGGCTLGQIQTDWHPDP